MSIRRKFKFIVRVTDDGDIIDSFDTQGILDTNIATRTSEQVEERAGNTAHSLKNDYTNILDVFAFSIEKADLSNYRPIQIDHGGCQIKADFVGFRPNDNSSLDGNTVNAAGGDEEFFNYIITGNY